MQWQHERYESHKSLSVWSERLLYELGPVPGTAKEAKSLRLCRSIEKGQNHHAVNEFQMKTTPYGLLLYAELCLSQPSPEKHFLEVDDSYQRPPMSQRVKHKIIWNIQT